MAKNKRHRARRAAVQALYQWDMTRQTATQIEPNMPGDSNLDSLDRTYFRTLIKGVPENLESIDEALTPSLDRPLEETDPVERAVLRVGAYELLYLKEIPWRVVLDEAIEIARLYGSDNGFKLVNTALERLATSAREVAPKS